MRKKNFIFSLLNVSLVGGLCLFLFSFQSATKNKTHFALDQAVIVLKPDNQKTRRSAEFLQMQISTRTGLELEIVVGEPNPVRPSIVVGNVSDFENVESSEILKKPEAYAIWIDDSDDSFRLNVSGSDERGVLFGVARLIRELYLSDGFIAVASDVDIVDSPGDQLRAQQIISNVQGEDKFMDWDDSEDVRQFIDDMIIFGANGFEPTKPELIDDYLENLGLDLFIKLKCQDIIDLNKEEDTTIKEFFAAYKGVDHITTYGGDASGSVEPSLFFPYLDRVIPQLTDSQAGAKWWYSNQCLEDHAKDFDEYIFDFINTNKPDYLYGMVYGPWTKRGITEIRADLPAQYVMRHFPDICHPRWAQYPVPQWDRAFAQVWERNKSIYAMPEMMLDIYRATRENTVGSLPYNHTGVYNDLNKFAWSAAGWNPEVEIDDLLHDYAKAFVVHDFEKLPSGIARASNLSKIEFLEKAEDYVVKGLSLLEANWKRELIDNETTEEALDYWISIADCIGGADKNWRVEMFLYKARVDAQIKRKVDIEKRIEDEVYQHIAEVKLWNQKTVVNHVNTIFDKVNTEFQSKVKFLAELDALGLTGRYGDIDRITSNIYSSLGDKYWILDQLENAESIEDLQSMLNYEEVEEAEFYDNLGLAGQQPHLVRAFTWAEDPGFVYSPIEWVDNRVNSDDRHSQHTHALARYDSPLIMQYDSLDPNAQYQLKVVYNGPFDITIKCTADDQILVHDFIGDLDQDIRTFSVPRATTSDGQLKLQWIQAKEDIMRGVSVSEIWLTKSPSLR